MFFYPLSSNMQECICKTTHCVVSISAPLANRSFHPRVIYIFQEHAAHRCIVSLELKKEIFPCPLSPYPPSQKCPVRINGTEMTPAKKPYVIHSMRNHSGRSPTGQRVGWVGFGSVCPSRTGEPTLDQIFKPIADILRHAKHPLVMHHPVGNKLSPDAIRDIAISAVRKGTGMYGRFLTPDT